MTCTIVLDAYKDMLAMGVAETPKINNKEG